jgi:hypothetical protein
VLILKAVSYIHAIRRKKFQCNGRWYFLQAKGISPFSYPQDNGDKIFRLFVSYKKGREKRKKK